MEKYKYPIFDIEPEKMNSVQIAEWIKACRTEIKRIDNKAEYLQAIKNFTDEWYRHYEA